MALPALLAGNSVLLPGRSDLLPGRSALVLYGSETGNAQDVAEEIGRLCERLRFSTHVAELDSISLVCVQLKGHEELICRGMHQTLMGTSDNSSSQIS
jgi:sulfite reductase alpha subunit-like flavoprotein